MSDPTRGQIEAQITQPTYLVEYWNGSAWVAIASNNVVSITGQNDSGGGSSGLDLGANAQPRITIELEDTSTIAAIAWVDLKVRARFGFGPSNQLQRLVGVVGGRQRTWGAEPRIILSCDGFNSVISGTPMYSNLYYRRLAATKTTVSSIEDPANGGWQGGLINYVFWQSGGRPLEQAASYPTALFYYQCDNSLVAPEWTWIAGEDAWAEIGRLARAVGGQIFQQPDGTMRFQNVIVPSPSGYTIDEGDYQSLTEDAQAGKEYFGAARCSYTARALQALQVVYEDKTPRIIDPSGTLQVTLEPSLPVYTWLVSGASTVPAECYVATDFFGAPLTPTVTYISRAAARVTIQIVNTSADKPLLVSQVSLKGRPIAPIEEGQATAGSGSRERAIGDGEIYVQSRSHAERLCVIYVDIYGVVRGTIRAAGLGYDPDRYVGEIIGVTCAAWGLSAVNHRINGIYVNDTGALMDLDLVPITGIPTTSELFMIGTSYVSGDTRQLSY